MREQYQISPTAPAQPPRPQIGSTEPRSLESDAVGALGTRASPQAGALCGTSFLGKRARGGGDDGDSKAEHTRDETAAGAQHQRYGTTGNRSSLCPPPSRQSAKVPPSPVPAGGLGGDLGSPPAAGKVNGRNARNGDSRVVGSGQSKAWSKLSIGSSDMAAVLRR